VEASDAEEEDAQARRLEHERQLRTAAEARERAERYGREQAELRAAALRVKSRRGAKKAILAVASSMLTAAYFMLRDGVEYHDLGARHFEQRDKERLAKRLLQRLRDLDVTMEVKPA
jgi:hypothetical protein